MTGGSRGLQAPDIGKKQIVGFSPGFFDPRSLNRAERNEKQCQTFYWKLASKKFPPA
jgi:hypothetical protein